jgi:hypothetical protein
MRPFALSLLLLATPVFAASQGDWFASLYTGEGVELRADERVFALFALFNAAGYDVGPVSRKDPVPKVKYDPVRSLVRAKVIGGDPSVKQAAEDFFDKHPAPMRKYLAYAVNGGQPPFSGEPKAKDLADLKGFEVVLAKAWTAWKLDEVMAAVQGDYRKALKGYLDAIDGPLAKERAILKVPDSGPQSLLVVNLLDTQDMVRGVMGDGEVVLVVGPSDKPNVLGLLKEYARVFLEAPVTKRASQWREGAATLKEAQVAGATEQTVADYATALFSLAVAGKALDYTDAQWDALQNGGYFGVHEIAKMFDEGKPVDGWVLDALSKAEARRPSKK